jgi:hypothetical protein
VTVESADGQRPPWLAGAALGMAANFKLLPVLLAPVALLLLVGTRRRLQLCVGATAAFLAGSLSLLVVAPVLVLTSILGYSSQPGSLGILAPRVGHTREHRTSWVSDAQPRYGKIVSLCLLLGASL